MFYFISFYIFYVNFIDLFSNFMNTYEGERIVPIFIVNKKSYKRVCALISFSQKSCQEKLNRQSLVSSFYTVFSRYIEFGNCMSILKAFKNIAEETYNDSLYCHATDFTETS